MKEKARPPSRLWNSLTVQLMIPISSRAGSLPPADHCLTTMRLLLLISSILLFRNRKMCPVNGLLHFCLCLSSCCGVCSGLCDPLLFFCFPLPLSQRCYEKQRAQHVSDILNYFCFSTFKDHIVKSTMALLASLLLPGIQIHLNFLHSWASYSLLYRVHHIQNSSYSHSGRY